MMRGVVISLALLAAGCGGDSYLRYSSGGSPVAGVNTTTVYVQGGSGSSSSTAGALLALFMIGQLWQGGDPAQQAPGSSYRESPFAVLGPGVAAPELDPSRRVNEQDCSRPIADWSANLKCK